jgi:hypothetical protein
MATWAVFEAEAPEMAHAAAQRWPGITRLLHDDTASLPAGTAVFSIAFLATTRSDGSPRVHPFCPILAGGRLFAAIPPSSPKGRDLRRDARCVIHALPGPEDDELCIRARAVEVGEDPATRALVRAVVERSGVGGMIESVSHHPLFELDIEQVDVARWIDIGQPGTHAARQRWRAHE